MTISHQGLAFIAVAAVFIAGLSSGHAQNTGPGYVVSYVEVAPLAQAKARTMLRNLRDAGRKEAGNSSFDILQRIDRPQHFVVLETWKDAKAQADHAAADNAEQVRDKLKPLLIAPYDERVLFAFATGPTKNPGARSIYAVTHVDFVGAKKDEGLAALKELSAASVKEAGVQRYDVLQQINKPNHITLVEIWRGKAALEAHEQSESTRKFREALLPIGGALYDQRLYRLVD
jgi:quinol monooxygenase YgiN